MVTGFCEAATAVADGLLNKVNEESTADFGGLMRSLLYFFGYREHRGAHIRSTLEPQFRMT